MSWSPARTEGYSLGVVPLAVEFAVAQKAGVPERVPARRAPHTRLVPEAAGDAEQESVRDEPVAPGAHCPVVHTCRDGTSRVRKTKWTQTLWVLQRLGSSSIGF